MPPTSAVAVYGGRDSVRLCRRQRGSPHDHTLRSRLPACPHTGSTEGSTSNGAINPPPAGTFPVITQLRQLVTRFEGTDARKPDAGSGPQAPASRSTPSSRDSVPTSSWPNRFASRSASSLALVAPVEPYDLAEALPGGPMAVSASRWACLRETPCSWIARAARQSGSARSACIRCSVPARSCLARRASSRARSFTRRSFGEAAKEPAIADRQPVVSA